MGKPEFDADWNRPLASMAGLPAVFETAGGRILAKHWRETIDYVLAALTENWRMRDGMGKIVGHVWRGERKKSKGDRKEWSGTKAGWSEWQWRAFEKSAEMMKSAGVELWLFEGGVNSALAAAGVGKWHGEFETRMKSGAAAGKWRFIPREELEAGIGEEDWRDMTHVNAAGREKLTRAMGRVLKEGLPRAMGEGSGEEEKTQ